MSVRTALRAPFRASLLALLAVAAVAVAPLGMAPSPDAGAQTYAGDPYPLDICPVSGKKLGKDAVTVVLSGMKDKNLDGTQMRFCCPDCEAAFKADPSKYLPKLEAEILKVAPPYPLQKCLLMPDEDVDGESDAIVYQNRVFRLCCGKCVKRFKLDPAKYAKAYETAVIAAQKPTYKAKACPISGKPLGEGAVDVVVNGRLIRACCAGCVGPIKADPKAAIAKIDA